MAVVFNQDLVVRQQSVVPFMCLLPRYEKKRVLAR